MEEQLISFDTAKLAKEKGFNIPTISYYNPKGRSEESEGYMTERLESSNWNNGQGSYPTHAKDIECSAPTQSLLQKWLREKHKIHIQIQVLGQFVNGDNKFYSQVILFGDNKWISKFISNKLTYTYEEALEIGLHEALKLI